MLEKASGASSKPTSTTLSVAYHALILRPPLFRKSARWSRTPRRMRENTGCGWSAVFATASSAPDSSIRLCSRSIRSAGRKGESQGTEARNGRLETDRPACNPASGPAYPPIASLTTRTPKVLYSSWFWLALMMMPPTCGASRSYTWSTRRLPRKACRPLSTPPMRLPLPPARISPVTEDCTARSPLRHHRRRDALPEAVLAGEEQVVFPARRPADHGDTDLVADFVAHLGEARPGNAET